jgi:hypothetical protein
MRSDLSKLEGSVTLQPVALPLKITGPLRYIFSAEISEAKSQRRLDPSRCARTGCLQPQGVVHFPRERSWGSSCAVVG